MKRNYIDYIIFLNNLAHLVNIVLKADGRCALLADFFLHHIILTSKSITMSR